MVNRKFVASQLKKLAAKMEEVSSLTEAKERGNFGTIYDFVVEKTFKKDWWERTNESYHNWGKIILLPSDGSENAKTQKIIRENITESIEWHCKEAQKYIEEYEERVKRDPFEKNDDRLKELEELFEKYGSSSEQWIETVMKNSRTINEFFGEEAINAWDDDFLMGNWNFGSPFKKYTLVSHSDGAWWVETSNSPKEILIKARRSIGHREKWEVLCTDGCYFFQ